jgi:putative ABC transport system permease protein
MRFYGNQDNVLNDVYKILKDNGSEVTDNFTVQRYVAYPEIGKVNVDEDMYIGEYFGDEDYYIRAYSETEYNKLIELSKTDIKKVDVGGTNNAIFVYQNGMGELAEALEGAEVKFSNATATITGTHKCGFVHFGAIYTMVFSDELFLELQKTGDISDSYKGGDTLDKATLINYTKSLNRELNMELMEILTSTSSYRLAYANYSESMEIFGLIRFIGFFMGAVVILMTASMLYFKQLMAAEEERHLYNMLRKVGMDDTLQRKAVLRRLLPVFMIPLAVGIVHSIFAMKSADTMVFSNMLAGGSSYLTVLTFSGAMYLAYAAVYAVFYLVTKSQYMRVIRS